MKNPANSFLFKNALILQEVLSICGVTWKRLDHWILIFRHDHDLCFKVVDENGKIIKRIY